MKRRFTILTAALALLAFLAIPMGMRGQASVTLTQSNLGLTGSYTTNTQKTIDGITYVYTDLMKSSDNIQAKASTGTIKNSTAYSGDIISVAITHSGTARATTINGSANGTDWVQVATGSGSITADFSGKGYKYFQITRGSNAAYWTQIEITYTTSSSSTVATPTFNPVAGTYTQAQNVSISCATEGATIYYTTNGDNPTTNSAVYTEAISVSSNLTIKAMATAEGYDNSAVATAEYAFITLDHAGTLADPYTVSDAHTAIDANAGTQNVYATGIVSAIPTAYNSTYGNITFNMIDEEGDEVFLQAYRCGGDEAANVAVGDVAVVYGNLIKYGSTYEFGQGCQLVSLTHPVINIPTVTVTPNTINAPAEGADGSLALTYENITNFISFDYNFCDANGGELQEDPNWIYAEINEENAVYSLDYLIDANDGAARTAYIKVYTYDDELEEVFAIVTVNQEEYVASTYAELPFEFDGGHAAIENTDGLYQEGLGSDYNNSPKLKFDGAGDWLLLQFEERPGILTFDIKGNGAGSDPWEGLFKVMVSTNGIDYVDKVVYETGDLTSTKTTMTIDDLASEVRYIKWIYTTKTIGNVALGNIKLAKYVEPVLVASITVNPDEVNVDAEDHDGTLDLTYENLTITDMTDFDIQFCDANGDELSEEPDWIEVLVAEQDPEIGEGYVVSYYMVENEGTDARTAYFKVYAMDDETNLVYSNLVTISQAAPVAPVTGDKYVKVTSTDDLTSGQYLIVYEEGSLAFDGGLATLDAVGNTIEVTISNNEIEVNTTTTASEFSIDVTAGTIKSASGYYIGQTSDANGMQTSLETAYTNTISFDESGNANIVSSVGAYLRYNSASNQTRFRYYKSSSYTGQKAIQLYKKVENTPAEYTLTIEGYGNSDGGYYLIASPVTVDLTDHAMTTGDFDLYAFNQAEDDEWRNYKAGAFTSLEPGKGYLYAHKIGGDFTLTGTAYDGDGKIELVYDDNAIDFKGWNLVGNPWGVKAYPNHDFYTMNNDGSGIDVTVYSTGTEVAAMTGIFVVAEGENETVTFSKTATGKSANLALNITNSSKLVDRAIVRFGEGRQLPKFQLRDNSTKIYFEQSNKDYAIVNAEEIGEMPVSFKAENNGTYTFSVNTENVEMEYLHLIDNMTGADIDLIANPSYSFEAKVTDYASRFRLVFSANSSINEQNANNFAFFNGNDWTINNEGEATLQVVDMTGRVLSTETVNGNATTKVNAATGVYMLRLINGNNIKTQKVVVK